MIDGAEVMRSAFDDFGVDAIVNGSTLRLIQSLDGDTVLDGEMINHTGPFALAKQADIKALNVYAGNEGDTLTIAGVDYTVTAIDPDGSGFVMLSLDEQP